MFRRVVDILKGFPPKELLGGSIEELDSVCSAYNEAVGTLPPMYPDMSLGEFFGAFIEYLKVYDADEMVISDYEFTNMYFIKDTQLSGLSLMDAYSMSALSYAGAQKALELSLAYATIIGLFNGPYGDMDEILSFSLLDFEDIGIEDDRRVLRVSPAVYTAIRDYCALHDIDVDVALYNAFVGEEEDKI